MNEIPAFIGQFRVLSRLSTTKTGEVFLGQSANGEAVAIKVLWESVARDPAFRVRLQREVQAAASVSGAFTAPLIAFDVEATRPWVATKFLAGPNLQQLIRSTGTLNDANIERLAIGLVEAVSAVHAAGITHCDISPTNIIWHSGFPVLIDFGLAREALNTESLSGPIGTRGFLAPEQIRRRRVSYRSDTYAVAACIVYARTGRAPYNTSVQSVRAYRSLASDRAVASLPRRHREWVRQSMRTRPNSRPEFAAVYSYLGRHRSLTGLIKSLHFIPRLGVLRLVATFTILSVLIVAGRAISNPIHASPPITVAAPPTSRALPQFSSPIKAAFADPLDIVASPDGSKLYVSYDGPTGYVATLDSNTLAQLRPPIFVGNYPVGIAISPDGTHLYVARSTANSVTIVDLAAGKRVGLPTPVESFPEQISVSLDGHTLYLFDIGAQVIEFLDASTGAELGPAVYVGGGDGFDAWKMRMAADGSHLLIARQISDDVVIVDTKTKSITQKLPAAFAHGADYDVSKSLVCVASYSPGSVLLVDPRNGSQVAPPLLLGGTLEDCIFDQMTGYLFILATSGLVYTIDEAKFSVITKVRISDEGRKLIISKDKLIDVNQIFGSVSLVSIK